MTKRKCRIILKDSINKQESEFNSKEEIMEYFKKQHPDWIYRVDHLEWNFKEDFLRQYIEWEDLYKFIRKSIKNNNDEVIIEIKDNKDIDIITKEKEKTDDHFLLIHEDNFSEKDVIF